MDAFIVKNYGFIQMMLQSIGHKGRVSSVHFAFGWKYTKDKRPNLKNKYVLAAALDKNKNQWDFPGGKNDSVSPDPVVQLLTTAYKELYEELAVTIIAPLETFVLEIIPCGHSRTSMLIVCGVNGLEADRFRDEMRRKHSIRPALPHQFLEMIDFMYLAADDAHALRHSTSYVRERHAQVLRIVEAHGGKFPDFRAVMRIGRRAT